MAARQRATRHHHDSRKAAPLTRAGRPLFTAESCSFFRRRSQPYQPNLERQIAIPPDRRIPKANTRSTDSPGRTLRDRTRRAATKAHEQCARSHIEMGPAAAPRNLAVLLAGAFQQPIGADLVRLAEVLQEPQANAPAREIPAGILRMRAGLLTDLAERGLARNSAEATGQRVRLGRRGLPRPAGAGSLGFAGGFRTTSFLCHSAKHTAPLRAVPLLSSADVELFITRANSARTILTKPYGHPAATELTTQIRPFTLTTGCVTHRSPLALGSPAACLFKMQVESLKLRNGEVAEQSQLA